MEIVSEFRIALLTGMIFSMLLGGSCLADTRPQPTSPSSAVADSLRQFLKKSDGGKYKTSQYLAAFPDLNGDGKPEAIVYLEDSDWCGSGGCRLLILTQTTKSWKSVGSISVAHLPILVLKSKSHGWHDLAVTVGGGGIVHWYEARLSFNGTKYPFNPSMPPAQPVKDKQVGEVVIQSTPPAAATP